MMLSEAMTAKLYWVWSRETGPGLACAEVSLEECERELRLGEAVSMGRGLTLHSQDLVPDQVVLEVPASGFFRLVERRNDEVIRRLLRRL